MAIKDILVHLDTTERGSNVTDFAIALANEMGAHLTAAGRSGVVEGRGFDQGQDPGGQFGLFIRRQCGRVQEESIWRHALASSGSDDVAHAGARVAPAAEPL